MLNLRDKNAQRLILRCDHNSYKTILIHYLGLTNLCSLSTSKNHHGVYGFKSHVFLELEFIKVEHVLGFFVLLRETQSYYNN